MIEHLSEMAGAFILGFLKYPLGKKGKIHDAYNLNDFTVFYDILGNEEVSHMTVKEENIAYRIRGVNAILHAIGEVTGRLVDLEFALLLLQSS